MQVSGRAIRVLLVVLVVVVAGCSSAVPVTETEPSGDGTETTATTVGSETNTAGGGVNGSLEVHYINVGQSLSVLVVGPTGETLLYDTGHYQDDGEHVLEYLEAHNISRIDHLGPCLDARNGASQHVSN